jgi:hypothetical protein
MYIYIQHIYKIRCHSELITILHKLESKFITCSSLLGKNICVTAFLSANNRLSPFKGQCFWTMQPAKLVKILPDDLG